MKLLRQMLLIISSVLCLILATQIFVIVAKHLENPVSFLIAIEGIYVLLIGLGSFLEFRKIGARENRKKEIIFTGRFR